MQAYTVRRNGPNTDEEFQAYVELLQDIGIDISSVPRISEEGTQNSWLYVWEAEFPAEKFAQELNLRLGVSDWYVHSFTVPDDQFFSAPKHPLAPLTIVSTTTSDGSHFRIDSKSLERIFKHYPNAQVHGNKAIPNFFISSVDRQDFEHYHGTIYTQAIVILTGLSRQQIADLGGVRIINRTGELLYYYNYEESRVQEEEE